MATDLASIISSYREKCARLLLDEKPDSAEYHAFNTMLSVFEGQDALGSTIYLDTYAHTIAANKFAPPEMHAKAREARAVVRQWTLDFKRDTGMS